MTIDNVHEPRPESTTDQTASARSPADLQRARVLCIDDSDTFRDFMKGFLECFGFEVVVQANPVKAVERFRRERETFKLVLLDYLMPELNGIDTFVLLKKAKPSIKVILVSGAEEPQSQRILAQHQFAGCIRKPFDLSDALQVIQNVLSHRRHDVGLLPGDSKSKYVVM